jgi:DNA-binding CsgD family transcriptional regulator
VTTRCAATDGPENDANYLSNALAKLDAQNRIDAIGKAQDAGWL